MIYYIIIFRQALQNLIAERPEESTDIKKIIDEVYKELEPEEEESIENEEEGMSNHKFSLFFDFLCFTPFSLKALLFKLMNGS